MTQTAVLDNVVWHAINGAQAHLADRCGEAARFHREVAPFSGISDDPSAWDDLSELIGPAKPAILFRPCVEVPKEWAREFAIPCLQMVADGVTERADDADLLELGSADVPEMLDLVNATRPGPFAPRTIELGRYLGVRRDGRLVAMTGERVRPQGYTEISAVCVLEDVRGQGLARRLVLAVIDGIRKRGEEAFLHVETRNTPAIALYETLGFSVRTEAEAVIVRKS